MVLFDKKHWHKKYFEIIEKGSVDKDSVTEWEYNWANLSFPDGYHPTSVTIGGRRSYKP